MKIIVIAGLVAVVASLFSALYYLYHDKGQGTRMVKALALRVALSVALVVFLVGVVPPRLDRADRIALSREPRRARQGYSQYTRTKSSSQTTSTKCQYHAGGLEGEVVVPVEVALDSARRASPTA